MPSGAHIEHHARELSRSGRSEEAHRVADLLGLDHVAYQLLVAALVSPLRFSRRLHQLNDAVGARGGRMQADDAHAVLARGFAHRLGERREPRIGRGAADVFEGMAFARHADDINDYAALARLHAW